MPACVRDWSNFATSLYLAIALGACASISQDGPKNLGSDPILSQTVTNFKVTGAGLDGVLDELTHHHILQLALELWMEDEPGLAPAQRRKPITLDLKKATVREVLEAALAQDRRYTYSKYHGYIVVWHKQAARDRNYIMNGKIEYGKLGPMAVGMVERVVNSWFQSRKIDADMQCMNVYDNYPEELLNIDLSNTTLRDVILEIGSQRRWNMTEYVYRKSIKFAGNSNPAIGAH